MLETQEGSGEYTVSETNTWPGEGYVFNANLSSCENGSKITWDDTKKQVLLEANTSDKCYIYFDKGANTPIISVTVIIIILLFFFIVIPFYLFLLYNRILT